MKLQKEPKKLSDGSMRDIITIRASEDEKFKVINLFEHEFVICDNWQKAKESTEEMLQNYVWQTRVAKRNDSKNFSK